MPHEGRHSRSGNFPAKGFEVKIHPHEESENVCIFTGNPMILTASIWSGNFPAKGFEAKIHPH